MSNGRADETDLPPCGRRRALVWIGRRSRPPGRNSGDARQSGNSGNARDSGRPLNRDRGDARHSGEFSQPGDARHSLSKFGWE